MSLGLSAGPVGGRKRLEICFSLEEPLDESATELVGGVCNFIYFFEYFVALELLRKNYFLVVSKGLVVRLGERGQR
jgi:hypothetical protein